MEDINMVSKIAAAIPLPINAAGRICPLNTPKRNIR
jgi:hypothetical protein